MVSFPVHLRYTLSRAQRLVPLLRMWGVALTPFIVVVFAFFVVQTVVNAWTLTWAGVAVFGGLALFVLVGYRGMLFGLLDALLFPVRHMDVVIEEEAAGVLIGGERWYLFLDGITDLRQFRADTWTIQHWNGFILHIAASALSDDLITHVRAAMERGRTPEGIRAVIERGRRIRAIEEAERRKS